MHRNSIVQLIETKIDSRLCAAKKLFYCERSIKKKSHKTRLTSFKIIICSFQKVVAMSLKICRCAFSPTSFFFMNSFLIHS